MDLLIYIHTLSCGGTPISQCHRGFVQQLEFMCVFVRVPGYLRRLIGGHATPV